ncbi:MAG: aminotransferase class IV [Acidimicrobiia bacterium]
MNGEPLSTASGAFETLRVYRGAPFAWRRHMERLSAAAGSLGFTPPDPASLRRAVDDVLHADRLLDARVRVTLLEGSNYDDDAQVIVTASAPPPVRPLARVVTASWPRNDRAATAGVKSTSYAENVRAFADARSHGADESVFSNTRGELCEATGSNVFIVERGVLRTPPPSSGCLLGVTRSLVIELAEADGMPVEEVARPIGALAGADEAFLTSTTREVQPIERVDARSQLEAPGPVTMRLAALYSDLVAHALDP